MNKMIKKSVLLLTIIISSICLLAEIPEASYWYPNDIIDWSPVEDVNAVYNVSHIPLSDRVYGEPLSNYARDNIKVMALSIMNPSTSGMPSQGNNNSFKTYPFTFWQYVDYLVAWAGSAGEGIIVPPSADVIDMAHKNGVPVLGTIFFPPNVYGGRRNWVDQLLRKDNNGQFIIGDKLIEIADYYGFDGWFINQETEGCSENHALLMVEFLEYIKSKKPEIIIVWYDSMSKDGNIAWQGELNENNIIYLVDEKSNKNRANAIFLDFRWQSLQREATIENTLKNMKKYSLEPKDVFVGMDLQANGFYTAINWPKLLNTDGTLKLSLGLYCPSWSYYDSKKIEDYWSKDEALWLGEHPVLKYDSKKLLSEINWEEYEDFRWRGIAPFVVEKTSITSFPFVSHFNAGHGYYFFIDGKKLSTQEWNNRSLQDVFPTYRWKLEGSDDFSIKVDYSDAYYGGTSLKFKGSLSSGEKTKVTLFLTDLKVDSNIILNSAVKLNNGLVHLSVVLTLDDLTEKTFYITPLEYKKWQMISQEIKDIYGKTIKNIELEIFSEYETDYDFNLGLISLTKNDSKKPSAPQKIEIDDIEFTGGLYAQLKLHWSKVLKSSPVYYEIYRISSDGEREFVWATYNNYTYINKIKRQGKEESTTLEVVTVDENMKRSYPAQISFEWPTYPKPKADFEVSDTIIMPGEKVIFTNLSSEVTEEITWILPGATPESSHENSPEVVYEKEGIYPATLIARNSEGEDIKKVDQLIVVTKKAKDIKNLALNKPTYASSFVPSEPPFQAVDGTVENNSKWCAVGDLPHWLDIDFEKEVIINKVVIKHAEAGYESPDWNTQSFKIQVSLDGETWKDVVKVENNTKGITEHSFSPVNARYLRFYIERPTQVGDSAARIYEVEVYGLESF